MNNNGLNWAEEEGITTEKVKTWPTFRNTLSENIKGKLQWIKIMEKDAALATE